MVLSSGTFHGVFVRGVIGRLFGRDEIDRRSDHRQHSNSPWLSGCPAARRQPELANPDRMRVALKESIERQVVKRISVAGPKFVHAA